MLKVAAGIVGVALFAQSVRILGPERILDGLGRVGWGFAAILLLSGAREAARTLAWMRTIEGPVPLRFPQAFRARLVGEALSTLLPMGIAVGEPAKASHLGAGIPFTTALSALAVEFAFYCGSLVLLLGAGVSTFLIMQEVHIGAPVVSLALIGGPLAAIAALRFRRMDLRGGGRAARGLHHLRELVFGFSSRHPEHVRAIVAFEIAFQIFAVAEVYLTLLLISPVRPTVASAVVLETVSRVITMLFKILPMRVGVDEVGSSMCAGRLDVGAAAGLTLAVIRKLRLLFWSAVGLALLARRRPTLA